MESLPGDFPVDRGSWRLLVGAVCKELRGGDGGGGTRFLPMAKGGAVKRPVGRREGMRG